MKILVIRLSAIGDVILTTSLLNGIRQVYKDAEIHWLAEPLGGEILEHNPEISRIIIHPRSDWNKLKKGNKYLTLWKEFNRFRKALVKEKYDLVLDAQGLLKSGIWSWLSGCRKRVGLNPREGSKIFYTHKVHTIEDKSCSICHEYAQLAKSIGSTLDVLPMSLFTTQQTVQEAKILLDETNLPSPQSPIFLFPFTTRPQKHWFEDRWSHLADELIKAYDRPVWILGGPFDKDGAERIQGKCNFRDKVFVRAGWESTLQEKMALVEQGCISIGVDTGLTHLSFGLNIPTIILFGSTTVYQNPGNYRGAVLYHEMDCSPCHRTPTCNGDFTCMKKHTVESILEFINRMIYSQ